jgi:hypothetical protein
VLLVGIEESAAEWSNWMDGAEVSIKEPAPAFIVTGWNERMDSLKHSTLDNERAGRSQKIFLRKLEPL